MIEQPMRDVFTVLIIILVIIAGVLINKDIE